MFLQSLSNKTKNNTQWNRPSLGYDGKKRFLEEKQTV